MIEIFEDSADSAQLEIRNFYILELFTCFPPIHTEWPALSGWKNLGFVGKVFFGFLNVFLKGFHVLMDKEDRTPN